MNGDDPMTQLLDAAVPDLPRVLQVPPLARIRGAARRRRRMQVGSTALVAVVAISAGLLAYSTHSAARTVGTPMASSVPSATPSLSSAPPPSPSPSPGPAVGEQLSDGRVAWLMGDLDRAGTDLVVYVPAPAKDCYFYPYPSAAATPVKPGGPVIVTVTARIAVRDLACRESSALTPLEVKLKEPLGTAPVQDGYDYMTRTIFRDAELPLVPSPWAEARASHGQQLNVPLSTTVYDRPGGPEIVISAGVGKLSRKPLKSIQVGIRSGLVYVDGNKYVAAWQVGELVYSLSLIPSEGAPTPSLTDLLRILDSLSWKQ